MKIKLKNIILPFFILLSTQLYSNVIYVNTNIIGGDNDGTSWQDAYTNFQDAIVEAVYGDSIWVAQGTYFPTSDTNQDISFELKNGVKWFGGFQGNETELVQRDFDLYLTTLSGDIGIQGDSTDNSYHVVYTMGSDNTTTLDGFLIVDGHAVDLITPSGSPRNFGGGLLIDAIGDDSIAKPKILNCIFKNNKARYGGGICLGKGYTNFHINPYIFNCHFIENTASVQQGGNGGAISLSGGNTFLEDTLMVENCLFQGNNASYYGGAISLNEIVNPFKFTNCDFLENYTTGTNSQGDPNGRGGAISYEVTFFYNVTKLSFFNCNFVNNSAQTGGGIKIYVIIDFAEGILALEIENSFFSNNFMSGNFSGDAIDYDANNKEQLISIKKSRFVNHVSNSTNYVININTSPALVPVYDNLDLRISGCEFIQNESTCLYVLVSNQSLKNNFVLSNNIFSRNKGLIGFFKLDVASFESQILNCIFFRNDGFLIAGSVDEDNMINISNSIFWEDLSPDQMFIGNAQGFNIHHSLLKSPDCLINGIDYCGDGMLYNLYPEFRDTMNNDFSLRSCSPAINQGDNLPIDTLGIFFDIEGNPRILDNAVDLGAYETQNFEVLVPQSQNVKCNGGADGAITWVQHGTPPFTFEWDDGVTTGTEFTGLSVGNYSIAVMDADNCLDTFTMTVNEPLPLEIMDTVTAATGSMNADGTIEVMPSGGFTDYQYLWNNGDTTALIENILPGIYTVTVTDANGCVEILEVEVGFMTAVNELDEKYVVQLIPNLMERGTPSHLVFDLEKNAHFYLEIFNELGQILFSKKIEMGAGRSNYELPMLKEQGLFFVKIKEEKGGWEILKWVIH